MELDFPWTNALNNEIPGVVCCMFVWEEREVRSTMAQYVAREPAMGRVPVPGDSRRCEVVFDTVRNTVAALAYWMIRLHSYHFSVDGAVTMDGFCINLSGLLKGTEALFHRLVRLDDVRRSRDMDALAGLARQHLYQTQIFGFVPPVVQDLLDLLTNFTGDQYLLLKSHPGHEDAMGQSSLYTILYGRLLAMKQRNMSKFRNVMGNMDKSINSPGWICDGIQNLFLHQMMRFSINSGTTGLSGSIVSFLTTNANCGRQNGEACFKLRRNGESHLSQDYCGVPAALGTEEAFRAAIAAATVRVPSLAMHARPHNSQALYRMLAAPFNQVEAGVIAQAIIDALQNYGTSTVEAEAAATYLAGQQPIYDPNPPFYTAPPPGTPRNQVHSWQCRQYQLLCQNYQQQQVDTAQAASNAAQAAGLDLQQKQAAPHPLMERNMFDVKDVSNMFTLMEPRLLCILHRAMFNAGELQELEWHWESKEIYLPP